MRGYAMIVKLGSVLSLLTLATVLNAVPVRAQEGPVYYDFDYGTIGLSQLKQLIPSQVVRPLDMVHTRTGGVGGALAGAAVASAEGPSSIAWNPAGLAWLKRPALTAELAWWGSSGATSGYPDTFNIPNSPRLSVTRYEVNLKSRVLGNLLGGGISGEILGGRTVAGALSYRRYLDVTYPEQVVADLNFSQGGSFPVTIAFDDKEKGGVDAAAATVAMDIIPDRIALGANLNYLDGFLRGRAEQIVNTGGATGLVGYRRLDFKYRGLSADIGLQVRQAGLGGLGLRVTPAYTLQVTGGRLKAQSIPSVDGAFVVRTRGRIAGYDMKVPTLLSVGGWVQARPKIRLFAEVNRQKWSETEVEYREEFVGREPNPSLPLRDVTTLHVAAEGRYLKFRQIDLPVRLGYWRGPLSVADLSPKDGEGRLLPADQWPVSQDINAHGLTFGFGFETGLLRYDVSYEVVDYKFKKFYFDTPYDPFVNPQSILVDVDRRVTQLRVAASVEL